MIVIVRWFEGIDENSSQRRAGLSKIPRERGNPPLMIVRLPTGRFAEPDLLEFYQKENNHFLKVTVEFLGHSHAFTPAQEFTY